MGLCVYKATHDREEIQEACIEVFEQSFVTKRLEVSASIPAQELIASETSTSQFKRP